jgi:hypothetical protein
MKTVKRELSEGEELIKEFLDEAGYKYETDVIIERLKEDKSPYRTADFYLINYKVYIEFLGQWDNEVCKKKYLEKKKVYKINKIPCIYVYPDNLGILNFIFKRRLKNVLKEYNFKGRLFYLNLEIFLGEVFWLLAILGFLIYYVNNLYGRIILAILFIMQVYLGLSKSYLK